MGSLTNRVDRHLNLFHSYGYGRDGDIDRARQLENNVTRAFIITVSGLSKERQEQFLKKLIDGFKTVKTDLTFDLQSITNKTYLSMIQKAPKKVLLTLSRYEYSEPFRFDDKTAALIQKIDAWEEDKRKRVIEHILKQFTRPDSETLHQIHIPELTDGANPIDLTILQSVYELLKGARPDAWIFNREIAIIVEAKIGVNSPYPPQLFRHLTDKHQGFGLTRAGVLQMDCLPAHIYSRSWSYVADAFRAVAATPEIDAKETFLITEFIQYLAMIGEVLSFSRALDGSEWTIEDQKNQLRLITDRLNQSQAVIDLEVKSSNRPLRDPWQQFGDRRDVHFAAFVDDRHAGIELTLRDGLLKKVAADDTMWHHFRESLWNCHLKYGRIQSTAHRYGLDLAEYHLFDHYPGLQSGGENRYEMHMHFDMEWINRRFKADDEAIHFLDSVIRPLLAGTLQAGIIYHISYPKSAEMKRRENNGKPFDRYKMDYDLLINGEELVKGFHGFINRVAPLYRHLTSI